MAIELDTERPTGLPVIAARGIGQKARGMVVHKEMRIRRNKDGETILNSRGKPANEEILTLLVLDGSTATVAGKDLDPDWTPETGDVVRGIFNGRPFGQLIDARKEVGGRTQVGDVIEWWATSAAIWRGKGDLAVASTVDENQIAQARAKGLTIGWNLEVSYRRANAEETGLVAKAEQLYMERKARIELDSQPVEEEPF